MPDSRTSMAESGRSGPFERDAEQAVTALKKGACLLKYGRRGKPKFCPFRLSNDETVLIWYSGKVEKQIILNNVSKIIPGQRTAIFKRYPRPDKEYQSFSLVYNDRSLDLICKDKDEAEVWFVGLKALISRGNYQKRRLESKGDRTSDSNSPGANARRNSPLTSPFYSSDTPKDPVDTQIVEIPYKNPPLNSFGKVFSDVILYTAPTQSSFHSESTSNYLNSFSSGGADNSNGRASGVETFRVSLSSAVSSSSHGSVYEDFDALGDVFTWGEGIGDGILGTTKFDALLPKALESAVLLDVHKIACGSRHAALATKRGEVFCWGEESGGRLGHGVDADVSHPKLVDTISGMNVEHVACGEYHTCAITLSGDLYTWGDGIHNSGLLGHGSEASHWIPKQVTGQFESLRASSVSCGPWHTAVVTSAGQLFTFGDGVFGALGHGDRRSTNMPREVEALKGMRTVSAACGVWHTAAVVEISLESTNSVSSLSGQLFTWGDGDKGRLGHGDTEHRLVPACVASLVEPSFCQVSCGHDITVALTSSGQVCTMGSTIHGPTSIEGKLSSSFVEEIACGSYHVAVLTSNGHVYTWGKGTNGQLGHGDNDDRSEPTLVEALKDKQVKGIACGSNFTAVICLHKWVSKVDQSMCCGCRFPFGFRRKRHNCYNCGLVFCKSCSSRKSVRASLAPNFNKRYRVCDECYTKLQKTVCPVVIPKHQRGCQNQTSDQVAEKETLDTRLLGQLSPILNGSSAWGSFKKSRSSKKFFSASVLSSRLASRSTSPVSNMPNSPHSTSPLTPNGLASPEVIADASKETNDELSQEVVRLKLQVEELTQKSQLLEAELEKTSRRLSDVTTIAVEQTAKCKVAKEVIKSLTAKLMAERVPKGYTNNRHYGSNASHTSTKSSLASKKDNASSHLATQTLESTGYSSDPLHCNAIGVVAEEKQWVEQAEPGVYITVSSFPGGEVHLRRVRFSRKRFTEQQAEKWWAENRSRFQGKYKISIGEPSATGPASVPARKDNVTN